MRVLVCGGRSFFNVKLLNRTLDEAHQGSPITLLIHGMATGADTLAGQWAARNRIKVEGYRPDWKKYGSVAGSIRNSKMLQHGKPQMVIAFPGGRGTKDMVKQARAADVPVRVIE